MEKLLPIIAGDRVTVEQFESSGWGQVWGGGGGSLETFCPLYLLLPLPVSLTPSSHPFLQWLPPLCPISFAKHYKMLQNCSQFLLVPSTLGNPPPALSSPASHAFPPGLPPSCPHPQSKSSESWQKDIKNDKKDLSEVAMVQ